MTPLTKTISGVSAESASAKPSTALPGFSRLAGAAITVGALPVALLLLSGRLWPAVSVAFGVGISLGVCGLLFLFIERVMPLYFAASRRSVGTASVQGSQFQFMLLLGAKLVFIALVSAAFLTLRHISPLAVVMGFVLGQSAIVVSAIRFRRPH